MACATAVGIHRKDGADRGAKKGSSCPRKRTSTPLICTSQVRRGEQLLRGDWSSTQTSRVRISGHLTSHARSLHPAAGCRSYGIRYVRAGGWRYGRLDDNVRFLFLTLRLWGARSDGSKPFAGYRAQRAACGHGDIAAADPWAAGCRMRALTGFPRTSSATC